MNTPTTGISKFLDQLIRPLFDQHVRSTTIIDGVNLIRRLETYVENDFLKPTTLFCTFDITDLYTMLPQEESLDVLTEFLIHYGYRKVKDILIDAIRKLARIVITENVFIYENKFYRQVVGGAMGSTFTLTLANIFMWKWGKEFIRRQRALQMKSTVGKYELFFSYSSFYSILLEDILMIFSSLPINQMLDETNSFHPNIK
jgi:hypothetical protein